MSTSTRTLGGWVRIGVNSDAVLLFLAFALSAGFAFIVFRVPITKIVEIVTEASQDSFHVALWLTGIFFILIAPLFLTMTSRPLMVDLDRRLMKVGWRTAPFDQLRHAYRQPSPGNRREWILQLDIKRGLDARLPMVTAGQPDLSVRELETLLTVLEAAPIEPKVGETLRAPMGEELGTRDAGEEVADRVSEALMVYTRVAFAKPTLLKEVQKRLASARAQEELDGPPTEGWWGIPRVVSAMQTSTHRNRVDRPNSMVLPAEPVLLVDTENGKLRPYFGRYLNHPRGRGMLGTGRSTFSRERNDVEEWLNAQRAPSIPRFATSRLFGWAIFLLALPLPWIFESVVTILTWPFLLWTGLLLRYRARIKRYLAVRSRAIGVLVSGTPIPAFVHSFFGPRFPERTYGKHVYAIGIGLIVFLIFPIFLFVLTGSFSMMAYWTSSEQDWEKPYFALVLALGVLCIALTVRWNYKIIRALVQAKVEWQLLGGS